MGRYREVLAPPTRRRRLVRHVESRLQPFRAATLVACGAIGVDGGSRVERVTDPDRVIGPGTRVTVERPWPAPCTRAFARLRAADFVSFGFAPGSTMGFDEAIRNVLRAKAGVRLIEGPKSLSEILDFLRTRAPRPIRDVYLGAHSWVGGSLSLPLTPGGNPYGIDYEDLAHVGSAEVPTFTDAELLPRPPGPGGKRLPVNVHIRGCRLGAARPWLERFKEALFLRVVDRSAVGRVSAPRHYQVAGGWDPPRGRTEAMHYGFTASSPTPLQGRADVVRLFARAGHRFADGRPVPTALWSQWIPAKDLGRDQKDTTAIVHPLDGHRHDVETAWAVRESTALFEMPAPDGAPSNQGALRALVKARIQRSVAGGALPMFAAGHPFPVWVREGFRDLDDYLAGFTWRRVAGSDGGAVLRGRRVVYTLRRPVVDPRNRLYVNFYPDFRGTERVMLRENDPRFFTSV